MFVGIEIGGTKLQFGVGDGKGGPLAELRRIDVCAEAGAQWIIGQINQHLPPLLEKWQPRAIGIGFGGPLDPVTGQVVRSHQVSGWDGFPLRQWAADTFGLPVVVANDADSAGLAEALFGAGRGHRIVFYTNVGSGIGGALVIDGKLYRGGCGIASEIGHLRPGFDAVAPHQTVENAASGWAIARQVRDWIRRASAIPGREKASLQWHEVKDLMARCGGAVEQLDTRSIAEAAAQGNRVARQVLDRAAKAFGWAVAQVITLLAPDVVVIGGGVSQAGEELWLEPVRRYVDQYVFPPLKGKVPLVAATLGQEVVVHGAIALAAESVA